MKNMQNLGSVRAIAADSSTFVDLACEDWARISARLRKEIGPTAYNSWMSDLSFERVEDETAFFSTSAAHVRDWIVSHYADRIRSLWADGGVPVNKIKINVRAIPTAVETKLAAPNLSREEASIEAVISDGELDAVDCGQAQLDPRFTFENFVVGAPNELAYAAARRVAESKDVAFNPLFLYGGVGLGKTHLMHAIAWRMRQITPERRVIYVSAEKFMYQFIRALRFKDTMAFKEQFRSVDVLMIDDIQFIGGKDSTQEEFFHTFNALVDENRQIIISADKSPTDLEKMEERLRSRLGWGLVADIHPTTYELRLGILQSKAESMRAEKPNVVIPEKVLEFLAHRITSNVREMEGALNRIVAHAELVGRPISLEATQDALRDLLRANDRRVTIEEIQKQVAQHFNIKVGDMYSPRRARSVARPRQVAMYLSKHLTQHSLPEIGKQFGGRDHTTVMYAERTVRELMDSDPAFSEDVELLRRTLES